MPWDGGRLGAGRPKASGKGSPKAQGRGQIAPSVQGFMPSEYMLWVMNDPNNGLGPIELQLHERC